MNEFNTIRNLEDKRAEAWIKRDKEALSTLLHKDYLEINIFGRFSKERVLEELFPQHELLEYHMSDIRWLDLGESACGLSYHVAEKLKSGEKVEAFVCHVVSIYKKVEKNWYLLLWQITPLMV